jgi:hypothetical protein
MSHNNYKILSAALFSFLIVIAVFASGSYAGGPQPTDGICVGGLLDGLPCDTQNPQDSCILNGGECVIPGGCLSDFECDNGQFCDGQEICDIIGPAGNCVPGTPEPAGTSCGDQADSECDNPDSCDGAGACTANIEPTGAACGDQGVECLENDTCDGAGTCADNGSKPAGTSCGDQADSECDNPDTCLTGACEPNNEPAGTACDDGAFCNVNDTCDGLDTCIAGSDTCLAGETCDEANDICIAGVPVDIKPMSCPNPLNVKNKGVLPVAILGTADFDATQVDITTVALAGVPAIPDKYEMEDVATPFNGVADDDCLDCTELGGDGMLDLVLYFYSQDIVDAIGSVEDGECLYPTLTGTLLDGTPIEGSDSLSIKMKK